MDGPVGDFRFGGMKAVVCLVVGGGSDVLCVQMDEQDTLWHLAKQLCERREDTKPSKDYKLFLAKKHERWLRQDDPEVVMAAEGELPPFVRANLHPSVRLSHAPLDFPNSEDVQEGDIHVLVVVPPDEQRSSFDSYASPMPWVVSLGERVVDQLPLTRDELRQYLRRELSEKITIAPSFLDTIERKDPKGLCAPLVRNLFTARGAVGHEGASKATYSYFWNSLIHRVLNFASHVEFRSFTKDTDASALYRPDVAFSIHNRCVFRGEEEARGSMAVPLSELEEKLIWRFGDAPYVFGYAVVSLDICLVAIRRDREDPTRAKAEIIQWYNMGLLHERLAFLLALLNLSTLFQPLVERMPPISFPEYGAVARPNGVFVLFAESCVKKMYPASMVHDGVVSKLETTLRRIQCVPNVVRLVKLKPRENQVILKPLGVRAQPTSPEQLVLALRDILKAVVALHAMGLMHRDLRWENVLAYDETLRVWFLIDFDDAADARATEAASHFDVAVHAPEMARSHSVEVDVWGIGLLVATTRVEEVPMELVAIKQQCLQDDPTRRPTAASLLATVEKIIGDAARR